MCMPQLVIFIVYNILYSSYTELGRVHSYEVDKVDRDNDKRTFPYTPAACTARAQ